MCHHSRCDVVRWLIVVIIAHLVGRIVSGVRVSASFQIIPCLVGWLGSEVWVTVCFQSFGLRMFVHLSRHLFCRPVCHPVPEKSFFCPVCHVMSCFRETRQWRCCAIVPLCTIACFFRIPVTDLISKCVDSVAYSVRSILLIDTPFSMCSASEIRE